VTAVTAAVQEKPSIYLMYGDQWGCYDCKTKGDRHWLERHPCEGQPPPKPVKSGNGKSKSKSSAAADMAKANQSGNGVLFGQDKQDILDDDQ
jgi:hypothetical protein